MKRNWKETFIITLLLFHFFNKNSGMKRNWKEWTTIYVRKEELTRCIEWFSMCVRAHQLPTLISQPRGLHTCTYKCKLLCKILLYKQFRELISSFAKFDQILKLKGTFSLLVFHFSNIPDIPLFTFSNVPDIPNTH